MSFDDHIRAVLTSAIVAMLCGFVSEIVVGHPTMIGGHEDVNFNLINEVALLTMELAKLKSMLRGEPMTGGDGHANFNLMNEVALLRMELAELKSATSSTCGTGGAEKERGGTSYVRWGRKTCAGNATLVYEGYAAGPIYNKGGGGSNFLCLPKDPDWDNFINGEQSTGYIAGVEYELFDSNNNVFSTSNTGGIPLGNNPAPCAVCYLDLRSTVLMVPAKTQCPDGWNTEYGGYLVSEYSVDRGRSSYVCWDREPEIAAGGTAKNQAVIYPVAVVCGSLPCSTYITGRELTCVVCSK